MNSIFGFLTIYSAPIGILMALVTSILSICFFAMQFMQQRKSLNIDIDIRLFDMRKDSIVKMKSLKEGVAFNGTGSYTRAFLPTFGDNNKIILKDRELGSREWREIDGIIKDTILLFPTKRNKIEEVNSYLSEILNQIKEIDLSSISPDNAKLIHQHISKDNNVQEAVKNYKEKTEELIGTLESELLVL